MFYFIFIIKRFRKSNVFVYAVPVYTADLCTAQCFKSRHVD